MDARIQSMKIIFPHVCSFFGYVILHMLTYAANIYFWRRYRINYPFIFGFKQGTELGYREVFLVSTGLAVLALGSFLVNLYLDLGSKTRNFRTFTELVPLSLVTVRQCKKSSSHLSIRSSSFQSAYAYGLILSD